MPKHSPTGPSQAARAGHRQVVVLDISTLRLDRHRHTVTVFTSEHEPVTVHRVRNADSLPGSVFHAFEQVLAAQLPRPVPQPDGPPRLEGLPVALYNPCTAQVAFGRTAEGSLTVFSDGGTLDLGPDGMIVSLSDQGLVLACGRTLPRVSVDAAVAGAMVSVHRDALTASA
jgi:hypothetical protein